jgi:quinol monooxygenase YgiN
MVKLALLARIHAKHDKAEDVRKLLESAIGLANQESLTVHWFALRFGPDTFGVFDTFAAEAGRKAHLDGPIAQALVTNAGLFTEPPSIERVELLAAKV